MEVTVEWEQMWTHLKAGVQPAGFAEKNHARGKNGFALVLGIYVKCSIIEQISWGKKVSSTSYCL